MKRINLRGDMTCEHSTLDYYTGRELEMTWLLTFVYTAGMRQERYSPEEPPMVEVTDCKLLKVEDEDGKVELSDWSRREWEGIFKVKLGEDVFAAEVEQACWEKVAEYQEEG